MIHYTSVLGGPLERRIHGYGAPAHRHRMVRRHLHWRGAFVGVWLDGRLDSSPILTMVGIGVGIAAAVVGMYRMLMAVLSTRPDSEEN